MVKPVSSLGAKSYWVVVADESRATIYAREKRFSPMRVVESLRNDTAREKDRNLVTDRSGRAFDSRGAGRHAMGGDESGTKLQSYLVFAKEIAERINSGRQHGKFDRLVVVAAPRFLGVLRPALMAAGIEAEREIDKEVTGRGAAFIQELIDAE